MKADRKSRKYKISDYMVKIRQVKADLIYITRKIKRKRTNCKIPDFTGTAFVTFETTQDASNINAYYKVSWYLRWLYNILYPFQSCRRRLLKEKYKNSKIEVEMAPDPSSINWENLGYKKSSIFSFTNISSTMFMISLLIGSVFLSYLLKGFQKNWLDDGSLGWLFSILIAMSILICNRINKLCICYISNASNKRYESKQESFNKLTYLCSFMQIINTCFNPLLATYLQTGYTLQRDVFSETGLQKDYVSILLCSIFIHPIFNLLNP